MTVSNRSRGLPSSGVESYRVSRRRLLAGATISVGGLAAAALIGCSGDDAPAGSPSSGIETATGTAGSTQPSGSGRLVQDPDRPYPYEYPEPAVAPKRGGILRDGNALAFTPADPTVNNTGGTFSQIGPVYDRLLAYKMGPGADSTKIEVEPGLAESWERSPDGLVITFHLRPNVKWQNKPPVNGRPFTAADVKFAYDRMKAEGVTVPLFTGVASVEAPDARTVRVTLESPLVDWLNGTPPKRDAPIFPRETVDAGTIGTTVIGTGPFILDQRESDRVSFVRNPDYWGREPLLDGAEFRSMPDLNARVAALRSGQLDHAANVTGSFREAKLVADSISGAQVQIDRVYTTFPGGFLMNSSNPKFRDERVRRALSLASDRAEQLQILFGGLGAPAGFIPWLFAFDTRPGDAQLGKWMKYDPAQAKQLLEAAGASNLVIDEVHYDYGPTHTQRAELLVSQWRKVGVTLNLHATESTTFTSQLTGRKIEEASTTGFGVAGTTADPYVYGNLHSKSVQNRWLIKDPKIDELAERQRVELNPAARRDLIRQVFDIDADMMYRIPFNGAHRFTVLQPWVRNVRLVGALGTVEEVSDVGIQLKDAWLNK